jgi:hypothetical protein
MASAYVDNSAIPQRATAESLPACLRGHIDFSDGDWCGDLTQITHCRNCGSPAKNSWKSRNFDGNCLVLDCRNRKNGRKCSNWFVCLDCKVRVDRRRTKQHFASSSHREAKYAVASMPLFESMPSPTTFTYFEDAVSLADPTESELGTRDTVAIDGSVPPTLTTVQETSVNPATDWLEEVCGNIKVASRFEVMEAFDDQLNMKYYFCAKHVNNDAGGYRYLVSRAFQGTEFISKKKVAATPEAIWHIQSFIQYHSMNQKQRKRQAAITASLFDGITQSTLFDMTRVLPFDDLQKHYGKSRKDALWNSLPIPVVQNFSGIAYINPLQVLRFMFAFAVEMDNFVLRFDEHEHDEEEQLSDCEDEVVINVEDCRASKEMALHCRTQFNGKGHTVLIVLPSTDWLDGFGSNRTKQNRKPIRLWTWNTSPPRDKINTVSNTFPIAIGMKKNVNWNRVEQQFRKDLLAFQDRDEPLLLYHGVLKKLVPVYVKRVASLQDKVERADVTSTLSCTSDFHRCFGKLFQMQRPTIFKEALNQEFAKDNNDRSILPFGWSSTYVDCTTNNGGRLPSCTRCRRKSLFTLFRLSGIEHPFSEEQEESNIDNIAEGPCSECADWTIDQTTRQMLKFKAPKKYPTFERDNCPLVAPTYRQVGADMELVPIDISFEFLKASARYAYYNASGGRGAGVAWNKETTKSYLRTCGVNTKTQERLYDAAKAAYVNNTQVDYTDEAGLPGFEFPFAWNGELAIEDYIELLMHLLFLGVASDNFELGLLYLKSAKEPVETFKKDMQGLLKAIQKFNLSWILAYPFSTSSKKQKSTTGTWVSENWLAWVRLSKIAHVWFERDGDKSKKKGSNDMSRLTCCFVALVSRLLTHSGVNKRTIELVHCYVKEFLSCTRELDMRARYAELARMDSKAPDHWWIKSNYLSLLNLCRIMRRLGPLKNFWDGGGKGERFIQEVKPHIPRGVRDNGLFMYQLMKRLYILRVMNYMEADMSITNSNKGIGQSNTVLDVASVDSESEANETSSQSGEDDELSSKSSSTDESLMGNNNPAIRDNAARNIPSTATSSEDSTDSSDDMDSENASDYTNNNSSSSEEENLQANYDEWNTPMEDDEMSKARTIYLYRNQEELQTAIDNHDPIATIVIKGDYGEPVLYALYRKPKRKFGWILIDFDDGLGRSFGGMWFAPMLTHDPLKSPPSSIVKIKKLSKMAAIAIPLKYSLDSAKNGADCFKYGVITNWWRERNKEGQLVYPGIDPGLYQCDN